MKLTIEGNAKEIKNVLQAIGSSKEHELELRIDTLQSSLTQVTASVSDAKETTADEALTKANETLDQINHELSKSYSFANKKVCASAVVGERALTVVITKPSGVESYKLIRN